MSVAESSGFPEYCWVCGHSLAQVSVAKSLGFPGYCWRCGHGPAQASVAESSGFPKYGYEERNTKMTAGSQQDARIA